MLIDWFTVVAQIVNFLVLVVLLKFLLYKRVIKAMDARQETVAASLQKAEEKEKQATEQAASYREKNEAFEQQRAGMLEAARQEADKRRKDLMQQAQEEVAQLQARWKHAVREETAQFIQQLRESVARQACDISRRALGDMADADLQDRMVAVFLRRIQELDAAQRRDLVASLKDAGGPIGVVSAFDISEAGQRQISEALQPLLPESGDVVFERDPGLVCGIKVRSAGQVAEWSLDGYLNELAAEFTEALRKEVEEGTNAPEKGSTPVESPQNGQPASE